MTELHVPETMHIETPVEETPPPADATPEAPRLSPRDQMMMQIAQRRQEKMAEELALAETYAADAREAAGVQESEPEPEPEPVVAAPDSPPEPQKPATRTWRAPDGNEWTLTDDQFEELARWGYLARQAQSAPAAAPASAPAAPPAPATQGAAPAGKASPADLIDPEAVKGVVRRLNYGNEDEAADALRSFVADVITKTRQAAPQIDPQQLATAATSRAIQALEARSNLETIGKEYPDLFANNTLSQLAGLKVQELRHQDLLLGRMRSDLDLFREACNTVVKDTNLRPATQPQPNAQAANPTAFQAASAQQREDRKRAAPRPPAAVSRAAPAPAERKPMSGSQIVEAMRKARGQPSLMN